MDVFSLVATLELQAENFFSGLSEAAQAMIDFAADSVKTGAEFDASMSKVSAIALTNVKFTDQQFEDLKKTAREMGYEFEETSDRTETAFNILRSAALATGASTKFTAKEASEALIYMGMAGWNAQEMLEGLPGVIALSAASGVELGRTSDIVTDALTAFGMGADQAADFADLLAITSARANTNVDLMGETFKYVASVAGAYGISAEDTAVAIGLMANRGIKASQAGTALRNVFSRLATDAGATSKQLGALGIVQEELGVDFYNGEGKVRDFSEFLTELRQKWRDLDPEQAAQYAKKIASMYGMAGFLGLMNATDEEVASLQADIANRAGSAQTMMDEMIDNLAGDITIFESAVQSAQIAISDKLSPTLREFVQYGTTGIQEFEHALRYQGIDSAMDILVGMVEGGADLLEKYLPEWQENGTMILSAISRGMEKAAPVIGEVVTVLGNMVATFLSQNSGTIANITASLVKAFIPAGLAIVTGIGNGIKESWPEISAAFTDLLGDVMPLLEKWAKDNIPGWDLISGILGLNNPKQETPIMGDLFGFTNPLKKVEKVEYESNVGSVVTNEDVELFIKAKEAAEEYAAAIKDIPEEWTTTPIADTASATTSVNTYIELLNSIPTVVGTYAEFTSDSGVHHTSSGYKMNDAASMSGGTILRGATMFGWDAQGRPHIGGGEGAEAVVGVNSLDQMIRESVNGAVSGLLNGLGGMISGDAQRPVYLVLDSGALVAEITPAINSEMSRIDTFRHGGDR